MILRRIAAAFRRQDWFTVFVETMIVVLGVFLGLQVNNWNAARQDRAREDTILTRLEADFLQIEAAARDRVSSAEERIATIEALIRQLRQEASPDIEAIAPQYLEATLFSRPVSLSPTYREIVSTGELSLIRHEPLRSALTQYAEVPETQQLTMDFIITQMAGDTNSQTIAAMAQYYSSFDQGWLEPRLAELFAQPAMIDSLLTLRSSQEAWLFWNRQSLEKAQAVLVTIAAALGGAAEPDLHTPPAGEAP